MIVESAVVDEALAHSQFRSPMPPICIHFTLRCVHIDTGARQRMSASQQLGSKHKWAEIVDV